MIDICAPQALRLRQQRQHLLEPLEGEREYMAFFRQVQPVKPIAFSVPGAPPSLVHRYDFDESDFLNLMRADRSIIKGRFGGVVGYIVPDDLGLFAAAYRKPPKLDGDTVTIYDIIQREGPVTPRTLKEMTGLLNKVIMPKLQSLQEAYLVYEDQVDGDWERGYYVFSKEFAIDLDAIPREHATRKLVERVLSANVFATQAGIKAFLRLPTPQIKAAIASLIADGVLAEARMDGRNGVVMAADVAEIAAIDAPPEPGVLAFHISDFLVRMDDDVLRRFDEDAALSYLMIDGAFRGVVYGKWRQGPHDIHAVVVDLPEAESVARKAEILDAVRDSFPHLEGQMYAYRAVGNG